MSDEEIKEERKDSMDWEILEDRVNRRQDRSPGMTKFDDFLADVDNSKNEFRDRKDAETRNSYNDYEKPNETYF